MKFTKIEDARKSPLEVRELELSIHSTDKTFEDHNYDNSDISELIGDISIFPQLEKLILTGFPLEDTLLQSIWKNQTITDLTFWNTELTSIPEGVKELTALQHLRFQYEMELTTLPDWMGDLTQLQTLSFYGCNKLKALPDSLCSLPQLECLLLGENNRLKSIPSQLAEGPTLDAESKKEIKKILKKIDKANAKKKPKKTTFPFQSFIDNVCLLNHEETIWRGIIFDWEGLTPFSRQELKGNLDDEMFEHPNLLPFGIFTFDESEASFSSIDEYFEVVPQSEIYLLIDKKTQQFFISGEGYTTEDLDSLQLRLY